MGGVAVFRISTMHISKTDVDAAKRALFARSRNASSKRWPDFKIRPISEEWIYANRMPAYKTAVANAAYIWRDSSANDRFGFMPATFAERRYELKGSGLILPPNAPNWAADDLYRVWVEADAATLATGDPMAVAAWHVMMEIPVGIPAKNWAWLVKGFVQTHLAGKGAAVAWAVHALEGADYTWIIAPHAHLVVTARHWRHDRRHGKRHPCWISSWAQQKRLEFAWRRRCTSMDDLARIGFVINDSWPML
jgi:hypothetical protein